MSLIDTKEFNPLENEIDLLRLEFGDLDEFNQILSDESYQALLNKYKDSPRLARIMIANSILAKFASEGFRQRVFNEDAYLGERYKNYLDFLKQKVSNPFLNGVVPKVYVGGIYRDDVAEYERRLDLIDRVFYQGQHARRPSWNNYRFAGIKHTKEVEETNGLFGM